MEGSEKEEGVPNTQRFWAPAGAAAMLSRGRRRRGGAASAASPDVGAR
jgi:hypothetical protein